MREVSSMQEAVEVLREKGLSKREILSNVDNSHFPFNDEEVVMAFIDLQIECSSDKDFEKLVAYLYFEENDS
ncbi:hypothetical protein GCM10010954_28860 [Halobacillus andaensis]|uniref:Uncharacterized protein n=1 Tax=Halobacillus andaensis TaxID=1176239 RepID=A0A917B888_HALAA|nr:hypothetical protein [Halobacillus andaensis]MBP2006517.1 hypothetical protein [Halobacillus andaensis]GGF28000.1 hypothetical protein GCM10010954_28860 [Halobacillus andaensis]